MKKIFSLLLLVSALIGTARVHAETGNSKVVKKGTTSNEKGTTNNEKGAKETDPKKEADAKKETDPKNVLAEPNTNTSCDDSIFTDPDVHLFTTPSTRPINIQDVYVGIGGGFLAGIGGINTPFKNGVTLNANLGVPLVDKYLLLEYNNNMDFTFSPNMDWFSKALSMPASNIRGVGVGFNEEFEVGLHVVIIGSRKFTFTAGPLFGGKFTVLPTMNLNNDNYYLSVPVSFCYGLKTNIFIGEHFYGYAQYSNTINNKVVAYQSQTQSDVFQLAQHIPADFGLLRVGIGYILKPWW